MKPLIYILITFLIFTQASLAKDLHLIPNLFSSSRNFEYSVTNGGVNGTLSSLGAGITSIYQHVYLDLSGERSTSASEEPTVNLLSTNKVKFSRTDFAASLGYAINDSVSLFSGYKYGKSTIIALRPSPFTGGKITLEGKGWFIGGGAGWPVKDWGTFSFSAAYALITADYKDLALGTAKGDAAGTSLTIKWKGTLAKNLYYDLSLIRHDYYYEDFDKFNWDISEQILSYRLGLAYRF